MSVRTFRLGGEPYLFRALSRPLLVVGHHPEDINRLRLQIVHRQLEALWLSRVDRTLSERKDVASVKTQL